MVPKYQNRTLTWNITWISFQITNISEFYSRGLHLTPTTLQLRIVVVAIQVEAVAASSDLSMGYRGCVVGAPLG